MITVLIGVSGSGKTTYAERLCENNLNSIRVNRDDLRKTLYGVRQTNTDYYSRKDIKRCEDFISGLSDQIIYDALNAGRDVIIDNTNLRQKYINDIISKFNHLSNIELLFMHGVSEDEYLEIRHRLIERHNGKDEEIKYLDKQWEEFRILKNQLHGSQSYYMQSFPQVKFNSQLPKAFIVDIDGTVALKGDRDIFDDSKLHLDTVIEPVKEVVNALFLQKNRIIYVSGRQDSCYDTTKQWLKDNGLWFPTSELYMRKSKDIRNDSTVKEEIIINDILSKYNVIGVIDDRMSVTRKYFQLGIFVFNVNQGFKLF